MNDAAYKSHQERTAALAEAFRTSSGKISLRKKTSNLFRDRRDTDGLHADVRDMSHVLTIDTEALTLDVEGMATYESIVDATLAHGLMPPVVPQLKTITIGGGVSGLAIESSSFREGLTHETVLDMDVLTAQGDIVRCSPTQNSELFHAIPNSYGTLGYVVRLTVPLRRVKPFVKLRHLRYNDQKTYFEALDAFCKAPVYEGETVQFIDGTIFARERMYITLGIMVEAAPYVSDYTYDKIFYQSIDERPEDYLTIHDYIWRWDTDWFWCSKNVGAQNPIIRRLLGRKRLGSRTYSRMMRFESKHRLVERALRLTGKYRPTEAVIQDVQVPVARASDFMTFFHESVGILPIWVCPTRPVPVEGAWPWTLYPMASGVQYVNIGFWDTVVTNEASPTGYYNRLIEHMLMDLGGTKSLYSDSYYTREEFEKLYNYAAYDTFKRTYDPGSRLKSLYDECVKHD